jgi:hypothetical protein
MRYLRKMHRWLNLDNPKTFNEKLQWLKAYDLNPRYTDIVDKYAVKGIIADKIGEEYLIPTLAVYESPAEIDWESLPEKFVLKCTHDSGGVIVCQDKSRLDKEAALKKLWKHYKRNYYYNKREWPYKNIKPRILAEQYMEDRQGDGELKDYKFFCFDGEPKLLFVASDRHKKVETKFDFFDMEFNHLPFTIDHDMAPILPEKPENFEKMKELAAKLSTGTPQLRVDFYEVDGKVYFGEMTFFHCSGMAPFHPEKWNRTFGDWVTLPPKYDKELP